MAINKDFLMGYGAGKASGGGGSENPNRVQVVTGTLNSFISDFPAKTEEELYAFVRKFDSGECSATLSFSIDGSDIPGQLTPRYNNGSLIEGALCWANIYARFNDINVYYIRIFWNTGKGAPDFYFEVYSATTDSNMTIIKTETMLELYGLSDYTLTIYWHPMQ